MKTDRTYYHILNVSPRATDEDVRRAYHALVLRWHPDRNPGPARARAQQMFMAVQTAYTILKTRPQREAYNRLLLAGTKKPELPADKKTGFLSCVAEILWPFALKDARHVR